MDSRRGIFVAGIVLGCALGFMSGHALIWSRVEKPEPFLVLGSSSASPPIRVADVPPQLFPTDLSTDYTIPEIGTAPDNASSDVALRHGEAAGPSTIPQLRPLEISPDEPQPIPVGEASPLVEPASPKAETKKVDEAFARQLRKMIDSELSEFPQSQRDVWFESLKEFSPDHVQGVLQMWKRFGAPTTLPLSVDPIAPPQTTGSAPQPVLPPGTKVESDPVAHGLSMARALHLRNLAHLQTIGYKRLIPMPVEKSDAGTPTFADCDARVDLSPGLRHETEQPLDWMISGNGFFVVQTEDSRLFTRNGHFTLDRERRVCLQEGSRLHPLVPELKLPEDTLSIQLNAEGVLSVTKVDSSVVHVGQVELARFANPAGLEPAGNAFFWETPASGPARTMTAENARCQIKQGAVELSNVQPEEEWLAIETLEGLLER